VGGGEGGSGGDAVDGREGRQDDQAHIPHGDDVCVGCCRGLWNVGGGRRQSVSVRWWVGRSKEKLSTDKGSKTSGVAFSL